MLPLLQLLFSLVLFYFKLALDIDKYNKICNAFKPIVLFVVCPLKCAFQVQ